MNYRELTPRERIAYHAKNVGLATAIGIAFAWLLVEGLAR